MPFPEIATKRIYSKQFCDTINTIYKTMPFPEIATKRKFCDTINTIYKTTICVQNNFVTH